MRFSRDRRGQSVVLGTVILFGFLILALSLYQVQVVPQQNAQVEFQHFEEVRNDLVELRAGILQAGSTDRAQYQTVRLGTDYSTRVFAINPPDPAGTIRTTESYPITIEYASNGTVIETIPTRFVQYRPGYNELDRSPTWYDASVLYLDARDEGGGVAVIEDQELVNDAGEVKIVAVQNQFRRSGTGRVTLELRPAEGVVGSIPEGDLNVTVPTRLSGTEYWDEADIPSGVYGGVTGDANGDGIHNLTLETTDTDLTVDTVGVQEAPEDPTQTGDGTGGNDGGGDGGGGGGTVLNYVDTFNDGDGNSEPNESNSIPPTDPIGDVNDFSKMTTGDDDQYGQISEADTGGNSYEMAIGLSVGGIPSRTSHALQIQYYMDKPEELTVNIVYENGTEIDSSTTYTLPEKKQNAEGTEEFALSNREVNYINNNGRAYLALNDSGSDNQNTQLYADLVRIESS